MDDEIWSAQYGNAPQPRPLVIAGAGGFGREVEQWVADINASWPTWRVLGFLDDEAHGSRVLGGTDWLAEHRGVAAVVAIGSPRARQRLIERLPHVEWPTIVHPSARLGRSVRLGPGCVVCPDVTMTVDVELGSHVLVNLDCTIGHDVRIGSYATLSPGVHVSGGVEIGDGADLGTGAVLRPLAKVGAWSVVGAGSVVIHDVPERCTAVGAPARAMAAAAD